MVTVHDGEGAFYGYNPELFADRICGTFTDGPGVGIQEVEILEARRRHKDLVVRFVGHVGEDNRDEWFVSPDNLAIAVDHASLTPRVVLPCRWERYDGSPTSRDRIAEMVRSWWGVGIHIMTTDPTPGDPPSISLTWDDTPGAVVIRPGDYLVALPRQMPIVLTGTEVLEALP